MKFELVSMGSVLKIYDDRLVIGQKGVAGFFARGLSGEKNNLLQGYYFNSI